MVRYCLPAICVRGFKGAKLGQPLPMYNEHLDKQSFMLVQNRTSLTLHVVARWRPCYGRIWFHETIAYGTEFIK